MTTNPAPPRLLALRVQGFKSFAERTNVEFGGGISAVRNDRIDGLLGIDRKSSKKNGPRNELE